MNKGLFALVLAGALTVPPISPALGTESTGTPKAAASGLLPLPPVPHLDAIPWLNSSFSAKARPNVDLELGPKIDTLGPFLLPPTMPRTQFSSSAKSAEPVYE
jgi:hypothetical protein